MQKIDLDRLHDVLNKIDRGSSIDRREGRTTAYIVRMAGEIELGDNGNTYLYLANRNHEAQSALRLLRDYIKYNMPENGIVTYSCEDRIEVNGKRFIFSSITEELYKFQGLSLSDVYIDLTEYLRIQYIDKIRFLQSRIKSQNEF